MTKDEQKPRVYCWKSETCPTDRLKQLMEYANIMKNVFNEKKETLLDKSLNS